MAKAKADSKVPSTDAEKEAAAVKPPVKDEQHGITRPKAGTQTGRVWEIADEISTQKGEPAPRKEVLDVFMNEGGNPSTGATQYGRWRKYHGLSQETGKPGRPKKEKPAEGTAPDAPTTEDAPTSEDVSGSPEVQGTEEEEA